MAVTFGYCWFILTVIINSLVCCLEPACIDANCYIPLHSKIGTNYSVYGITQGGAIFVADMMTFSNAKFLNDLKAIDARVEHFDCSTATVHFVSTNLSILKSAKYEKNVNFFIIDAPKARIMLPSCNWTVYSDILYCQIYWPMTKFVRIHRCYHPKYYYARWSNKLYYLCYNDDGISNQTLFINEGLKLGLLRYGYKDIAPGFVSLNDATTMDYLGQIIVLNEMDDHYPNWLQPFQGENALKPEAERLLSCIIGNKIRYVLQTTIAQFCIFEILTLSFRMTVQLLPNDFNKVPLLIKDDQLSINVLPLIITRQKSMVEEMQISGDVIGTLNMDVFINITLAVPLYTFIFIIISILFIRWRITLIPKTLLNLRIYFQQIIDRIW
ncbi:unnamed protein product [Acanthocheilonema viteae]|uniref:Uncharacterized protein n=1 Tax=Acanthocheilonema viteae TaxID=6277 RepID=A0A498SU41_ACAVI|nr:unnamed protein product [Acanthocheilonema viteae]